MVLWEIHENMNPIEISEFPACKLYTMVNCVGPDFGLFIVTRLALELNDYHVCVGRWVTWVSL